MTPIRQLAIAAAVAGAAAILAAPAPALAAGASGRDYGQHVRACAQTMGFSGSHNPGMHQGYAGWDGMTCQM